MTEAEKAKINEALAQLTKEELIDMALAMKEELAQQTDSARAERIKIMHDFFHPPAPAPSKEVVSDSGESADDPLESETFKKLQRKIKYL